MKKITRSKAFYLAVILLVGLLLFVAALHVGWPARPAPIPDNLHRAAWSRLAYIRRVYVYDFWGNFIDRQHLWRIEADPEVIDVLAKGLQARELPSPADMPERFWRQPAYWWQPRRVAGVRCFASPLFDASKRGQDGRHYLMMADKEEGVIYVWEKDNF